MEYCVFSIEGEPSLYSFRQFWHIPDVLNYVPEFRFSEEQIAAGKHFNLLWTIAVLNLHDIDTVFAGVVKGLAFLHSYNISHRDIKSGNVLLRENGEVKLGMKIFFSDLNFFFFCSRFRSFAQISRTECKNEGFNYINIWINLKIVRR